MTSNFARHDSLAGIILLTFIASASFGALCDETWSCNVRACNVHSANSTTDAESLRVSLSSWALYLPQEESVARTRGCRYAGQTRENDTSSKDRTRLLGYSNNTARTLTTRLYASEPTKLNATAARAQRIFLILQTLRN